jgi:hypothetical protein
MKKSILFLALIAGYAINAQTNFSGTWGEPQLEMVSGKQYSNAVPKQIMVTQTNDSLIVTSLENTADATPITQRFSLNGKPSSRVGKTSKRTIVSTANWSSDKKTLTIVTAYSFAEKPAETEYKNTEVWELNSEGSLFITKTSDATLTDDWTIKATYNKQ